MSRIATGWLACALAAAALAGCVSDAGASSGETGPKRLENLPPPSSDMGQVVGLITDEEFKPVPGAQVGVLDVTPALSVLSDEGGAFVLDQVPPGTHKIAAQKLGFNAAGRTVDVVAGQKTQVNIVITPVPVLGEARHQLLVGDGYFACGADTPAVTWGNLHACVWDEHKPRFVFKTSKTDWFGILQEVAWKQSTALTSQRLSVYLQYKPVCDPFCSAEKQYTAQAGPSPVRNYADVFEKDGKKFKEDPVELASMTFPNRGSEPVVVVFQQRMTHYITQFWGGHWDEAYTAVPDQ